jgi:hypothetical protein
MVTKLGEFSPLGQSFKLRGFLKMAEAANILGYFFPL